MLVCLSLLAIQLWMTLRARDVQLNEAARESANPALVRLVERLETDGGSDIELARIYKLLVTRVAELPQLRGIFICRMGTGW